MRNKERKRADKGRDGEREKARKEKKRWDENGENSPVEKQEIEEKENGRKLNTDTLFLSLPLVLSSLLTYRLHRQRRYSISRARKILFLLLYPSACRQLCRACQPCQNIINLNQNKATTSDEQQEKEKRRFEGTRHVWIHTILDAVPSLSLSLLRHAMQRFVPRLPHSVQALQTPASCLPALIIIMHS